MRISPLRIWLQSTSLLAVIAGYSLLLLFNQQIAFQQRTAAHLQLAEQLVAELGSRASERSQLQPLLNAALLPGLRLQLMLVPLQAASTPALQSRGGQEWLVSRQPLEVADGSSATLQVEQNVTASVQQEWLALWLLVIAAGLSSLFTSGLLRLVLQRGLVQPLQEFTAQLAATQAPPLPSDQIPVAEQPEELQPIAEAFNDLQERLRASWERQRSFVDGVAHELRTPITLISGHAQRLLRQPGLEATAPSLQLIQQEALRMGSLVSNLLDLARIDSGRQQRLALAPRHASGGAASGDGGYGAAAGVPGRLDQKRPSLQPHAAAGQPCCRSAGRFPGAACARPGPRCRTRRARGDL